MVVVLGLIILIVAVVVGVAGVFNNVGSGHALTHSFSLFGDHITGSTGALFLYGIVVGAAGMLGLGLLLAGARRTSRRGRAARRELKQSRPQTAAVSQDRDLIGQRESAQDETARSETARADEADPLEDRPRRRGDPGEDRPRRRGDPGEDRPRRRGDPGEDRPRRRGDPLGDGPRGRGDPLGDGPRGRGGPRRAEQPAPRRAGSRPGGLTPPFRQTSVSSPTSLLPWTTNDDTTGSAGDAIVDALDNQFSDTTLGRESAGWSRPPVRRQGQRGPDCRILAMRKYALWRVFLPTLSTAALPVAEQSDRAGGVAGIGVIRQRRPVALEPVIGSDASPALSPRRACQA